MLSGEDLINKNLSFFLFGHPNEQTIGAFQLFSVNLRFGSWNLLKIIVSWWYDGELSSPFHSVMSHIFPYDIPIYTSI